MTWIYTLTVDAIKGQFSLCSVRTWIYTLTVDAIKGQFRFVFSQKDDVDIHAYCRCHQGSVQV